MSIVSRKRLYLDANGNVTEDENAAVSLLVGAGGTLDDATAKQYGVKGDAPEVYDDAAAAHEALHGGETEEQAQANRKAMMEGKANKAKAAPDNKAKE